MRTAVVEIPFIFPAKVIPPRCRNQEDVVVLDMEPVCLPADDDAPLACVFDWREKGKDYRTRYFLADGVLWMSLDTIQEGVSGRTLLTRDGMAIFAAAEAPRQREWFEPFIGLTDWVIHGFDVTAPTGGTAIWREKVTARQWVWDNRLEHAARASEEAAKQLGVINGELCCRTMGPAYVTNQRETRAVESLESLIGVERIGAYTALTWRPDFAQHPVDADRGTLTLLDANAYAEGIFSERREILRAVSFEIVDPVWSEIIPEMTPDAITAYADLVQVVDGVFPAADDHAALDAVQSAVETLHAGLPEGGPRGFRLKQDLLPASYWKRIASLDDDDHRYRRTP